MRCAQILPMLLGLCLAVLVSISDRHSTLLAAGPDPIPLWPDGAPGAIGTEEAGQKPTTIK